MMIQTRNDSLLRECQSEQGFVLVVALWLLVVLSLVGIAALNTTGLELQIAGNDRQEKQVFFGVESGCMRGGQWLKNLQLLQVEEYGDDDLIDSYISENDFTKGLQVHDITTTEEESNLGDADYPVKYLYGISEGINSDDTRLECKPIKGHGPDTLNCYYDVVCSSNVVSGGSRIIDIAVTKPTDFK